MRRNKHFYLRKIGQTYFLQEDDNIVDGGCRLVFLNSTGVFLWEKMEYCVTAEELVSALTSAFDVSESLAKQDVSAFLSFLSENGCIISCKTN